MYFSRLVILMSALLGCATAVSAADIKILATAAWPGLLRDITPDFERATGSRLAAEFAGPAEIGRRVTSGEAFDVVLSSATSLAEFSAAGLVARPVPMGVAYTVVAYRKDTPEPDASTRDAVARLIKKAGRIAYSDPKSGAGTALYFVDIARSLGLDDTLKEKAIIVGPARGGIPVEEGTADFGIALSCEVAELKGIASVRLIPSDPRDTVPFAAGLSSRPMSPSGAQAALTFFQSAEMKAKMTRAGIVFDP